MRIRLVSSAFIAAGVFVHAGCAHSAPARLTDRMILHRDTKQEAEEQQPVPPSLEEAIGKVRQLMAEARPEPRAQVETLETKDPALRDALATFTASPTAATAAAAGAAYHRHGLLDRAYEYYSRGLRLEGPPAAAYEGLARLWRDWRLPHLALSDAYRAIYAAPRSASARNTLGTVLQALGQRRVARDAYAAAAALDPGASYAFNNLCYLSFLNGHPADAIAECGEALRIDPGLAAAHNNLALTYAAAGRLDLAREEFTHANRAAQTAYNMGVVFMARRQFAKAVTQFDQAGAEDPTWGEAQARAGQARRLAATAADEGDQE